MGDDISGHIHVPAYMAPVQDALTNLIEEATEVLDPTWYSCTLHGHEFIYIYVSLPRLNATWLEAFAEKRIPYYMSWGPDYSQPPGTYYIQYNEDGELKDRYVEEQDEMVDLDWLLARLGGTPIEEVIATLERKRAKTLPMDWSTQEPWGKKAAMLLLITS